MEAASNTATRHFYQPELLHGTYFKYKEDEDEVEREDIFQQLPGSSLGTNDNAKARATAAQDPLAFAIRRKRERRKKLATKATKKLFPSLSKGMVTRSNKLNKGQLCLKWHSATKAQRAQHLREADLLNTLDWLLVAPVHHCLGCHNTKCKFQPWIRHAYNIPSTINSKATWDSQSHKHPRFAKKRPPKGLEKILFQQSDAKTTQESSTWADGKMQEESSDNTSWNSPPLDATASSSPATATTDQLHSVQGVVVTAEKKKRNMTKPHSLGHGGALEIENLIDRSR
eukprot:jgi/Psemu1/19795/gm1.19795_g